MTAKLIAEQRWMRVEEAAVYANVGVTYVRKLIRTRRLPAMNTGRYYVIDRFKLDACLEGLEAVPSTSRDDSAKKISRRSPLFSSPRPANFG